MRAIEASRIRLRDRGWTGRGRGVLRVVAVLVSVAVLGTDPSGAAVQETAGAEDCRRRVGDLGISGLGISGGDGHLRMAHEDDGTIRYRFFTEPSVLSVSGPAEGRLRSGDVLVAVDGHPITTPEGSRRFGEVEPGESVRLRARRDGRLRTVTLVAGSRCLERPAVPATPAPEVPDAASDPDPEAPIPPDAYLGFSFRCSDCGIETGEEGPAWFFSGPLAVTEVHRGGPVWDAGVRAGDELVAIDGHALDTEEGAAAFGSLRPGRSATVRWRRPDGSLHAGRLVPGEPRRADASPGGRGGESGRLRYAGVLGDVAVEVRGRPVIVTREEGEGRVTIQTEGLVITLRRMDATERER